MEHYEAAVADLARAETWCRGARALAQLSDPRAITPLVGAFNRPVEADKGCLLDALRALGAGERAAQFAGDGFLPGTGIDFYRERCALGRLMNGHHRSINTEDTEVHRLTSGFTVFLWFANCF